MWTKHVFGHVFGHVFRHALRHAVRPMFRHVLGHVFRLVAAADDHDVLAWLRDDGAPTAISYGLYSFGLHSFGADVTVHAVADVIYSVGQLRPTITTYRRGYEMTAQYCELHSNFNEKQLNADNYKANMVWTAQVFSSFLFSGPISAIADGTLVVRLWARRHSKMATLRRPFQQGAARAWCMAIRMSRGDADIQPR